MTIAFAGLSESVTPALSVQIQTRYPPWTSAQVDVDTKPSASPCLLSSLSSQAPTKGLGDSYDSLGMTGNRTELPRQHLAPPPWATLQKEEQLTGTLEGDIPPGRTLRPAVWGTKDEKEISSDPVPGPPLTLAARSSLSQEDGLPYRGFLQEGGWNKLSPS